jgi:hypothetical protein
MTVAVVAMLPVPMLLKKYFELYYYYYHYDSPIYHYGGNFLFIRLPGKMNYPRHCSGKLPDRSLHFFPSNLKLPGITWEFSKNFLLALKRLTGKGENATKQYTCEHNNELMSEQIFDWVKV